MGIVPGEEIPACITRVAATRKRKIRIEALNKNAGRHPLAPGGSEPEANTPVMARDCTARPPRGWEDDGMTQTYRERVVPGVWWIVVALLFVGMVSVAYGAALGAGVGVVVFAVGAGIVFVGTRAATDTIIIDDGELGVGRARVPLNVLGAVRVLTSDDVARARRGFDPQVTDTAFTRLPPWGPSHAIWVEVTDDSDPHSGWLVASRHPEDLGKELTEAIAACHGRTGE